MTRLFASIAAAAVAASALVGAGGAVADPPAWSSQDHRGDQRGGYARPGYDGGGFPVGPMPGGWGPRDRRGDAHDGYSRPVYDRGGGDRRYPPPNQPPGRYPNAPGGEWRAQQDEARFGVNQGRLAPLGRVIETIGRRTPGRQLDAAIEYMGGRAVYRVRWMTHDGRRIDYLVDAATGTIMSER